MLASRVDDQGDLARARCSAEGNVADADLDEKTVGRDFENDRKIDRPTGRLLRDVLVETGAVDWTKPLTGCLSGVGARRRRRHECSDCCRLGSARVR